MRADTRDTVRLWVVIAALAGAVVALVLPLISARYATRRFDTVTLD